VPERKAFAGIIILSQKMRGVSVTVVRALTSGLNGDVGTRMSAGKKKDGGKTAQRMSTRSTAMRTASAPEVMQGGQGRVKDAQRDKRLAQNRMGPTGQGRVKDISSDKRLARNRPGPTGQGRVKNPTEDRRLSANRQGPTGQGRVKDPEHDRRLSENRPGPTGQGRVKNPARDRRLRDNRAT
jgi:hypothetical protein